eukprot:CAMPEP_0183598688 /NCGR_PEP_ID=MMETSP0371-20130417/179050_1 /TAXON_ID=268820 /ORGANISM="Peridinium aciculiferum, Strain PAER-2" /LENGTH=815 /DNA_ID=CAMNT_0025810747 /DNA_START=79 /DNA_END=2523 /DNA_ORIENTATION=-
MTALFAGALLVLSGRPAAAASAGVTPVQKVIQLMDGMLAKGKEEKHGEQVQFAAFKQFCDDTTVEKKRAIEEANEKIDMLKADIEKYTATAEMLTKEIAEHDEDISVWTGDQQAATKVREIEKADYDTLHQDYSESVDALQRAIAVLKKQAHDRPQAEALVQVSALKDLTLIPDSAKKTIDAFLLSVWTGDQQAATKVREIEKADYDTLHQDYSESVDALQRAIAVLKKQAHDRPQAEALVQVSALKDLTLIPDSAKKTIDAFLQQDPEGLEVSAPEAHGYEFQSHGVIEMLEKLLDEFIAERTKLVDALQRAIAVLKKQAHDRPQAEALVQVSALKDLTLIPDSAKKTLDAFLQQDPEGLEVSAPEAHGYEFQSHGVIEMLEKLLDEFIAERTKLEKEEMNGKHAYDMLMQDLTAQIAQATQDREEKSEAKAKALQAKADAEGDLKDTTDTRDADQKYLDDLTATCEQKASDFESRQQLRAEELEAITKAIEIISSGAVAGNADKHLPSLAQQGTVLAMLRADTVNTVAQGRVAQYLMSKGRELNSRVLTALAERVTADPFVKVKKMIKDLIVRLMEEANEEAEHKGWCDTELSTNEQTRKEKTEAVETLHAEIDQLEASIAKLTEDIAELTKAVAELDAAMAEATKLRQDEKAKNTQTIADSQEAQTAVAQALTVLKEFYEKAGDATALLQQQPSAPEIFDAPYKGMQSENGGIVGMLEVIESDFARLEADTKASEASAQKEYDTFMTDSKVDKESKTKDIEHKTAKKQDEEQALTVKNEDLEGTQKELDAALAYFDKLKPSCVDAGVSFEDR